MKITIILILFFCGSINTFSQTTYTDDAILDKVLLLKNNNGSYGCGIIIKYHNKYILTSASHVMSQLQKDAKIYFRTKKGVVDSIPLLTLIPNPNKTISIIHRDADVQCIVLTQIPKSDTNTIEALSFQFEDINSELIDINRQYNIIVYGYPLYSFENFASISINSYLSSSLIRLPRADNHIPSLFYLLSHPGMQGFSGGPVFIGVSHGGMSYGTSKTILIGLIHGTVSDVTGGKFAMITPSFYIYDLLKSLKL